MKNRENKIFFFVAYCLYFVSLFLRDIGGDGVLDSVSRYMRLLSYGIIALHLVITTKLNIKRILKIIIVLAVPTLYGLYTGDLYWSILTIFIISSRDIESDSIYGISFKILAIGSAIVVGFALIGVLPDSINSAGGSKLVLIRHSLGFYHSNVLPLLILYMEIYYIILHRNIPNYKVIIGFALISILVFSLCGSRNAFILTCGLSLFILCRKMFDDNKTVLGILFIISNCSVLILSTISVATMFLLGKGGIWDKIDYLFNGRFRLGYYKMIRVGLHFINFMSNSEFFSDSTESAIDTIIIDNGYLYAILRYGIIAILFYLIVSVLLTYKAKGNYSFLVALIVVFVSNFVDNDLFDYSFLPLILFAFYDNGIEKYIEKIKRPISKKSNNNSNLRVTKGNKEGI
ncbi:MAG: hypothetical protein J6I76_07880 [Oribacterium sp.]|nr:hypothetical protein [Oribacterium sp.]